MESDNKLAENKELNKKILVVDDDRFISRLLTQTFEFEGFSVSSANNGKDAIKQAETFLPDLIILDVMMPEMDGWDVCKELKSRPDTSSIPIIMLTAKSQGKDFEKGKSLGVAHYVAKPFNYAELLEKVKGIVNK
jgi:DNA-binding response OmpR family regulator